MKKFFVVPFFCIATSLFAQNIQVGDSVVVNATTKYWMTGERISAWVYSQSHRVSQVGSSFHPNGILLNIDGAKSWIKENEVTKCTNTTYSTIIKDSITIYDTIVITQETERIVYIHDTIINEKEVRNDIYTTLEDTKHMYFQLYGNINQYFGGKSCGTGGEIIFGIRMTEFTYLGGGLEFGYWGVGESLEAKSMQFPVFVHSKIYVPVRHKLFPYIDMSIGANMGYRTFTIDEMLRPSGFYYGMYAKGGIGLDLLGCLSIGAGYQYGGEFSKVSNDLHHAYIKLGFVIPN